MPNARPLEALPGGREAFDRAHAEIAPAARAAQQRFCDALDALGPPGAARWDQFAGEIELRGRVFRAEVLGSFDGTSWLWAWANEHWNLPTERMTRALHLRARGGVFAEPMIAATDEMIPYMMGDFALAFAGVEAYWIANPSLVFVFEPGQLVVPRLRRLASCFIPRTVTLEVIRAHLGELELQPVGDGGLEVEREGFTVRISRLDDPTGVAREAAIAGTEATPDRCALLLETRLEASYAGTRYGTGFGMWGPTAVQELGPLVSGPLIASEALFAAERLNTLPEALLYDLVLRSEYPKA